MNDALPLLALAGVGFSLSCLVWIAGRIWLRAKELERLEETGISPNLDALLERIDQRLRRVEHATEATAIEVERILEAQRFAARLESGQPGR